MQLSSHTKGESPREHTTAVPGMRSANCGLPWRPAEMEDLVATHTARLLNTNGRPVDIAHKSGGLTIDIETGDSEWARAVISWDQMPALIKGIGNAALFDTPADTVKLGLELLDVS